MGDFTLLYAPTNLVLQRSAANEVILTWSDVSTIEDGYVIERKQNPQVVFTILDTLRGSGSTYVDSTVEIHQSYAYRIKAYKGSLESAYSNEASMTVGINEADGLPQQFSISQNYPNPFNPTTTIRFSIAAQCQASLQIFNVLGQEVATLVDEVMEPGEYSVDVNAEGFASGIYLYRLRASEYAQTRRMTIIK